MFATKLWGHFIAFMWDWVATGPTTQIIGPQQGQGVFYNADTLDDVSQWVLALGKQDKPEELKEKLDQGKIVFNYGGYFVYRQQDWDQTGALTPSGNTYADAADEHPPAPRPRRSSATSGCGSTGRSCTSRPKARSSPAPSATCSDIFGAGYNALDVDPLRRLRRQGRLQAAPRRAQDLPRGRLRLGRRRPKIRTRNVNYQLANAGAGQQLASTASRSIPTTTST